MTELILFCYTCKHFLHFDDTTFCMKYMDGAPMEILISKQCQYWDYDEDDEED